MAGENALVLELAIDGLFLVGDTCEVIFGKGPFEGDHAGTATVTGFATDHSPILAVHFEFGGARRRGEYTHAGRLIVYDREMHLCDVHGPVAVGDTIEAVRGNGPREGDHMGTATVTGFETDGMPTVSVRFDGA